MRQCPGLGSHHLSPAAARLFVGRESELASLRASLAKLDARRPAIAYVHGQSGIGKTHLIEHFLEECTDLPDLVLLRGRCYEQESVPYKALDSVVDSLSTYLAGLPDSEAAELMPPDTRILAQVFPVLRRHVGSSRCATQPRAPKFPIRRNSAAGPPPRCANYWPALATACAW